MSFTAGAGEVVVVFQPKSLHGTPVVGAHMLRFSLGYTMPPWPDKNFRLTNIQARVSVGKEMRLLGRAFAEMAIVLASTSYHQDAAFLMDLMLTPRQMEEIEKIRHGDDLNFVLDIFGELYDGYSHRNSGDRIHMAVNQKSWIDILKELNFTSSILIEIPHNIRNSGTSVWKALEKAKEHLYYGHYDDVVASCRKALEGIPQKDDELSKVRNMSIGERTKMTKRQRLVHLLDALKHYTHPAHHLESPEETESYSRNDAILVYGATLAAVATQTNEK